MKRSCHFHRWMGYMIIITGRRHICTQAFLYCTCVYLTGDGHGDVLADDNDLSLSSGNSTELIRMFLAVSRRRLCTGLDGAENTDEKNT
jgi:hypothetical protein